jgi:hypothetical protein
MEIPPTRNMAGCKVAIKDFLYPIILATNLFQAQKHDSPIAGEGEEILQFQSLWGNYIEFDCSPAVRSTQGAVPQEVWKKLAEWLPPGWTASRRERREWRTILPPS